MAMKNFQYKKRDYLVDAILSQRLTPLRMALAARAQGPKDPPFSEDEFEALVSALVLSMPDSAPLVRELENIRAALETGFAPDPLNLSYAETQLAWGAALLLVDHNLSVFDKRWKDAPLIEELEHAPLWQQALDAPRMQKETYIQALYLSESLKRTDVRFSWRPPGGGFSYKPEKNELNADFVLGLILGLEHARALTLRETGRSQISAAYPPRMTALREKMMALDEKRKAHGGSLPKEEYRDLRMLSAEWELRNALFEAAEGNCLNGFVGRMGDATRREYSYSLNHAMTAASPYGEQARRYIEERREIDGLKEIFNRISSGAPDVVGEFLRRAGQEANDENVRLLMEEIARQKNIIDEMDREEMTGAPPRADHAFMNVISAVSMSFFKNNKWFEDAPQGWRKVGVLPEWVRRAPDDDVSANDNKPALSDFQRLMDMCGGPDGLENMRPSPRDRWYGRDYYKNLTAQLSDNRNEIIERIWDEYLDHHFREMKNQIEQQIDQELENQGGNEQDQEQDQQQGQQDGAQGQKGKGKSKNKNKNAQQNQNQQSQGGDDDAGDGADESQENDSSPGQPQQQGGDRKQKQQKQQKQGESRSGEEQQKDESGEQGESGGGEDGEESQDDQDSGFDPSKAGVNKEGRKTDVDMGSQKKQMPDVDLPPESPQGQKADNENNADGQEKDGQEGEGKDKRGKTLQEIMDEMNQKQDAGADQGEGKEEGQKGQKGSGQSDSASGGDEAGEAGEGRTLEDIAKGDWSDYPGIVAQLAGPIAQVARVLKRIQEKQVEKDVRTSHKLQRLPDGSPVDTLEIQAHRDFITKVETGQPIEDRDRDRFRREEQFDKPAQMDIVLLIDGSGSMDSKTLLGIGERKATPLEVALLAATIINEAAKQVGAGVRISLWGSNNPVMLARPGDDPKTIGRNIVSARSGLGSGTELSPSIRSIVKELSEREKQGKPYRGYTHMMIISDGAIDDEAQAHKDLNTLLKSADHVTMDFAIIKDNGGYDFGPTAMESAAKRIKAANPAQQIGIIIEKDVNKVPALLVAALLDKINRSESFKAIPASRKRSDFRRAGLRLDM